MEVTTVAWWQSEGKSTGSSNRQSDKQGVYQSHIRSTKSRTASYKNEAFIVMERLGVCCSCALIDQQNAKGENEEHIAKSLFQSTPQSTSLLPPSFTFIVMYYIG
jgi:hypothetical protein